MKMVKTVVFRISVVTFFVAALLALPSISLSQEACPALDCDCASLPDIHWRDVCYKEETKLKRQCVANASQPSGYCLVHGPSAKPLPMALDPAGVTILPEARITQHHEKNTQLYWSVRSDFDLFKQFIKVKAYAEAKQLFNGLDKNIEKLFTGQRQVTISFETIDKRRKARSLWAEYADQNQEAAKMLHEFGEELWGQRKVDGNAARDKALRILSLKLLRAASKAYEMAGYGYSTAAQDKNAALAWRDASEVSLSMLRYKSVEGAPESHINYYSNQVAVRLFRSGYHWQILERSDDADNALRASREYYVGKQYLINDLLNGRDREDEAAIAEF